jgi:hypothetical protein
MLAAILQNIPLPYINYARTCLPIESPSDDILYGVSLPQEIDVPTIQDGELLSLRFDNNNLKILLYNRSLQSVPVMESPYPTIWLEAMKNGRWQPIEYTWWPRCATGVCYRIVRPGMSGEAIAVLWPGVYRTQIRVGLYLARHKTTYSKPIFATINQKMFDFRPDLKDLYVIDYSGGIPVPKLVPPKPKVPPPH